MRNKVLLFILIIVLTYSIGGIVYVKFFKEETINEVNNVDKIEEYGYVLKSSATDLYKDEFSKLKVILSQDEINYENYALSVSKLFIIDLYTLKNKINKYDIGGLDFVYPSSLDNFKLNVENTLYKYLEDNTNNNRNQDLPVVSAVNVIEFNQNKFKIDDSEFDSYHVDLQVDYELDLEYPKKVSLTLIMDDNKYYIVEAK